MLARDPGLSGRAGTGGTGQDPAPQGAHAGCACRVRMQCAHAGCTTWESEHNLHVQLWLTLQPLAPNRSP